jgi:N-acetylglutamate synthase-like GNAT family acetyltransferase
MSSPIPASSIPADRTWRRADLADAALAARVLAVQHAAYAIEAELIGYPGLPPAHETLEALQSTSEELWLCEEDDELLGVLGLEHAEDELLIARLFVAPAVFRRGVGAGLVALALEQASGRPVRVGTGARNLPALRLYEGYGFRRVDECEPAANVGYIELIRRP